MPVIKGLLAQQASVWAIVAAILLIALGAAIVIAPAATSLLTVVVLAWFVIAGGLAHVFSALGSSSVWSALLKVLVGIAYFVTGIALGTHPLWGAATLTLVVTVTFAFEGFVAVATYLGEPAGDRSGWTLFNGIVTLILTWTIWSGWPGSSLWVLGTLVGANLLVAGVSRLQLALAARRFQRLIESA